MRIMKYPVSYYVQRLQRDNHFAFVGYSDAEWFSIVGHDIGRETGLGQILDSETGIRLLDVLKRRHTDPNFMFASPACIWYWEDMISAGIPTKISSVLAGCGINDITFYERDIVLDDLAAAAGLAPWIKQLRSMRTVLIGNEHLRNLSILSHDLFVEVSCPNLHLEINGIEKAVDEILSYGRPAVYLVSAGMSAALIIDQIYDHIPKSSFIDCGSIWDTFVGIGAQRGWRQKLYADPQRYQEWIDKNLDMG